MIDQPTIAQLARLYNLKPWQQEKHYIQSIALTVLAEEPLVFKGGTYLWFFHGLNRFSEDLDFTASESVSQQLPEKVSEGVGRYGVENQVKTVNLGEKSFSFRIQAKGPLYREPKSACFVYVEISLREPVLKKTIPIKFDYPAYQLPTKNLSGMGLDEVGAEKARAIMTRRKARDLYDLWYLIQHKKVGFDEKLVNQKLELDGLVFSKKAFFDRIQWPKSRFEKDLRHLVLGGLTPLSEIQKTVKEWVQ